MSEATWYCARDGRRLGPFDFDQLRQMAADGAIRPHDLVLKEGDQGWRAASAVPGLMPAGPTTPTAPAPGVATTAQGSELWKWVGRNRNGVFVFVMVVIMGWGFWKYGGELAVNQEKSRQLKEWTRRLEDEKKRRLEEEARRAEEEARRAEEEARRAEEERQRQVPTGAIEVRKDQGMFSHDVRLRNASAVTYGRCDVKLVVYYDRGKRSEVTRYWTTWAPKDDKVVNIPPEGNIERVDLTGTMTDEATGQAKTLGIVAEWKPGKAAPPPSR